MPTEDGGAPAPAVEVDKTKQRCHACNTWKEPKDMASTTWCKTCAGKK